MTPAYLHYCITMALHRSGEYVPSRLVYLVLCMPKGQNAERLYAGA